MLQMPAEKIRTVTKSRTKGGKNRPNKQKYNRNKDYKNKNYNKEYNKDYNRDKDNGSTDTQ